MDKHSTGGIGDKVSLPLAPLLACLGFRVPMISGRGLGITGGTLDKLDSIPGFKTLFCRRKIVAASSRKSAASFAARRTKWFPPTKKFTRCATPPALCRAFGLIVPPSCKKLAESIDALILDVKFGCAAFMKREEDSVLLAELMVETGQRMEKKVVALITDMNQPLGRMAGHSNEIAECVEVLNGGGPADLVQLSIELSAWMFFLGDRTKSVEDGRLLAETMISSGQAKEKFKQCIRLQGGDERVIDDPRLLPQAKSRANVLSPSTGFLTAINCEQLGTALATLGGGREKKEDTIRTTPSASNSTNASAIA